MAREAPAKRGTTSAQLWLALMLLLLAAPGVLSAAEVIPPVPPRYFNDDAKLLSPAADAKFDRQLQDFERTSSNRLRVAIFSKMQSDSSIDDYTLRVANAWRVGMKGKDNGAVLFIFVVDRKVFIQVGSGLEGALPDAICKRIIDVDIEPAFKQADYENGIGRALADMISATNDEYQGTPTTQREANGQPAVAVPFWRWLLAAVAVFAAFGVFLFLVHNFGGTFYQRHIRSLTFAENVYLFFINVTMALLSSAGSGSSSGGDSGGGFASSGGGSFSGGGAGGSW